MSHSQTNKGESRFAELDGLRALAVACVILFHCEVGGLLDAGFFGVDIFFMISGFIITANLVKEHRTRGDFRFAAFYFRRLKRLLPPVFGLIVLAAATAAISDAAFAQFRSDVPAALAYVSNWWQIWNEQSYFDTTPHVLKHLWSLAVEEQFYFVWPLLAYACLKRRGAKAAGALALLLALAGTAWMWYLYQLNIDAANQNRIYLGTDTHAMGLFAGAALAGFWNPWTSAETGGLPRLVRRLAALLSLAALAWMVHTMNRQDPAIYRGGFLLVPVLTCVLAYCTMSDRAFFLSRFLRSGVMQWLGSRSYSLYLVHWLVFCWMRLHGWTDFSQWTVMAAGLAAVGLLGEAMYRCTEVPSKRFDPKGLDARRMSVLVLAYTSAAAVLFAAAALHGNRVDPLLAGAPAGGADDIVRPAPPAGQDLAAAPPDSAGSFDPGERISGGEDIFAIGDSVLKGAQAHLEKVIPGIRIDAAVGRQASQGLKVVKEWRAASGKASTVLVHLGTNGFINEDQFRALLRELADHSAVILVNVHAARRWTRPNNEIIARMPAEFPNVRVIDWDALSSSRPDYFVRDGIHLTGKGMLALTAQIKGLTGGTVIIPAGAADTMLAQARERAPALRPPASGAAGEAPHKGTPLQAPLGAAAEPPARPDADAAAGADAAAAAGPEAVAAPEAPAESAAAPAQPPEA